ncbi:NUDIX hydrolase [Carbonactinospora thermoautotrophica]|uniref:NUDIX hydrolase n=1 Tax=Carbonactinospora thermoautotrophica TaxID=1469144 RepID=A0A132N4X3_9ACTN|nr:NUDIX domain-containing protein [Carbonactinospora thermoautotrophica]KWX05133.1 NUDIX hydrolase [Carbonactinospora thermoautotrophica]
MPQRRRVPCVGALVYDAAGRLLLVRRTRPPAAGSWSLPGGRVEPGETDARAVAREVQEETGLDITVGALVGVVEQDGPDGAVYEIRDYACEVRGGTLRPGGDAGDARWVSREELTTLPTSPGLVETLAGWRALPRS